MNRYIFPIGIAAVVIAVSMPLAAQGPSKTAAPMFRPEPSWPAIPNNWLLGEVSSVAVDAQDHVWILHRPATVPEAQRQNAAPPVLEFDSAGRSIRSWGGAGAGHAWPPREHGISG